MTSMERREINKQLLSKNLKERNNLEDTVVDGKIILAHMLKKYGAYMWTGFI